MVSERLAAVAGITPKASNIIRLATNIFIEPSCTAGSNRPTIGTDLASFRCTKIRFAEIGYPYPFPCIQRVAYVLWLSE